MPPQRYSVILTRDDSYIWPWEALVIDNWRDIDYPYVLNRARGKSADEAILKLKARLCAAGEYSEQVCLAFESVTIEYDNGRTLITATNVTDYARFMSDENVTPHDDENDSKRCPNSCAKCHIVSAKYPNGDPTQIEPHLNRYGIKQLLCFLCRLDEHLAKLKADKRMTTVMGDNDVSRSFEAFLDDGDIVRAHSYGIALNGHLPTITPQTIEECRNDMERTYF
jgi:hypothetical protein